MEAKVKSTSGRWDAGGGANGRRVERRRLCNDIQSLIDVFVVGPNEMTSRFLKRKMMELHFRSFNNSFVATVQLSTITFKLNIKRLIFK